MRSVSRRVPKANPVSVGGLLSPVVARIGCGTAIVLDMLQKNWEAVVGETNARNSEPSGISGTILTVAVSSPVWMTQARFMKKSFLEKINRFLESRGIEISDITFTLDKRKKG